MRFSLETVTEICGQPSRPLADCPLCRAIPAQSRWYEEGDKVKEDTIPPEAWKLVPFILLDGTNLEWTTACPHCGRVYWMTDEYDYSVFSPSTTDRTVTRIDGADTLFEWMRRTHAYDEIVRDGNAWRARGPGLFSADRREPPAASLPEPPPGSRETPRDAP